MFIINCRVLLLQSSNASLQFNSIQQALKINLQPYNWSVKNESGRIEQSWGLGKVMMQLGLCNM